MKISRSITVQRTPRFMQTCGKFDLDTAATSTIEWDCSGVVLPAEWSVGVIVGPSMAGKSTVARELFPDQLVEQGDWDWPADQCIADGFPDGMSINDICGLLSSVGFSSPPDWKKPYKALSNGGKFRVYLARTLAERPQLAVIDEFGSLVHAQARQVAAAAAAKAVRRRGGKLVAICVHPDAVPFFEPDWIIEIIPGHPVRLQDARGSVQRPEIKLQVVRADRSAWEIFRHHHYLNHDIHRSAACFVGLIDGQPATFTAVLPFPHPTVPGWREHRTVCLPDFQGIGLGNRMSEFVAGLYAATGKPFSSCTSHPSMIRHRCRSPLWKMKRAPSLSNRPGDRPRKDAKNFEKSTLAQARTRITAGFEFIGPPNPDAARKLGLSIPAKTTALHDP